VLREAIEALNKATMKIGETLSQSGSSGRNSGGGGADGSSGGSGGAQ
jgi:hypothetical protein